MPDEARNRNPNTAQRGPVMSDLAAEIRMLREEQKHGQQAMSALLEQILVELKASRRTGGAPEDLKPKNKGGTPGNTIGRPSISR